MTQVSEGFQREDISFCVCCGQFLSTKTGLPVDVSYEEMPTDFAIKVMLIRKAIEDKAKINIHKRRAVKKRYRFEP